MVLFFSLASIALYLIAAFMLLRSVRSGLGVAAKSSLALWLLAMLCHAGALMPEVITADGIDLSLFNAISLSALLISLILFIVCTRQALSAMGMIILPITAVCVALAPIETADKLVSSAISAGIQLHIVASLLAYSLLIMASIQALAIYRQTTYLKLKDQSTHRLISTLPTLDAMESFLFALIKLGIVLLTIGLVSGWLYHEDLFAQHLMHKTVLSVMAWLVFGIVLVGKQLYGWRTSIAVGLVLIATGLLILGYLGSKFVLEVILDKI